MKRKILSLISAVTMAFTLIPTVAVAEDEKITDETIKIMPIGDSITHGYQSSGGYRKYFYHFLSQDFNIDMVGANSDYPDTFTWLKEEVQYDTEHCGYSGYAIQYMDGTETRQGILETLQDGNYLQTYDPDIIMLQIGTNDILSAYNDGITERLGNLINYISDNTSDDTVIFVSTIPHIDAVQVFDWCWAYGDEKFSNTPEDFNVIINNYVDKYNNSIPLLVDKLQEEGKNVEFADIYSTFEENGLTTDDYLEDGVHPNEKGYARIGINWADKIFRYLFFKTVDSELECPYRVADLVSLSNYVLGRTNHQITEENYSLYDINGDGVLDSFDLGLLRQLFIEKNIKVEKVQSVNLTASTSSEALNTTITEIDKYDSKHT
ncbi:MAG: GDSL-type esterase/lipase family protein [Muribaculaceae bacterium]|nr:GDSL-type esterase/lipase family protein [Alistipes senegalensis]MCM1472958.1 GDSL-type esterase/lipase family protein [Muribaculaceae bacterium]